MTHQSHKHVFAAGLARVSVLFAFIGYTVLEALTLVRPAILFDRWQEDWTAIRRRIGCVFLWSATVVSNIGSWMYNVASDMLMMSLDSHPVSLAQVANARPMFLPAVPAGGIESATETENHAFQTSLRSRLFHESLTISLYGAPGRT